ncbi:MAG: hypothetical protein ACPGSD_12125 [Flavobacteriales bacterium]
MADLQQEVWINQLKENFYPDSTFLKHVTDLSEHVNNHKLNLTEVGVDPKVLINNKTYPIAVHQRVDKPLAIELNLFETENTLIRRPEDIEYSESQLESVIKGHRESLRTTTAKKGAHAIAPDSDGEFTPVIRTSGEVKDGFKWITPDDILDLKVRYDLADIPLDQRYLVLNPLHVVQLIKQDRKTFKDITDLTSGKVFNFAGFNILEFSKTPIYNSTTGSKKPFGAAPAANDTISSFAFHKSEVMKAEGEYYMHEQPSAEERGVIIGFDKRFVCMPFRNKGIGSIITHKE